MRMFIYGVFLLLIMINPMYNKAECEENAIQNYFRFSKMILLPVGFDNNSECCVDDNGTVYMLNRDIINQNNKNCVQIYNTKTEKMLYAELPDSCSGYLRFAINKNKLVLYANNTMVLYDRQNDSFKFEKRFLTCYFQEIKVDDNYIYCINCYSHLFDPDSTWTSISRINISTGKVEDFHPENPYGTIFTFITPRHLVDCNNSNIIIADAVKNNIKIYDWNLKKLDSISFNPKYWTSMTGAQDSLLNKLTKLKTRYIKNVIDAMHPLYDSVSQINQVHFIDSNNILADWAYTIKGVKTYYFNIYSLKYKKWVTNAALKNMNFDLNTPMKEYNNKWEILNNYDMLNSKLTLFESIPIVDNILQKSIKELKKDIDEYYKTHEDVRYSLFIMDFTGFDNDNK